jgi:uncharacterized membrane protein
MLRARVGLAGSVAFSLLLLTTAGGVARSDSSSAPRAPRYEYIYGAELMSPQEREAYRRELSRAQGEPERAQVRERQRKRLHQRAREHDVTLDASGVVRRRGRKP